MDKRQKEKRYNELSTAFKAYIDGNGPKPTEAESDERIRLFTDRAAVIHQDPGAVVICSPHVITAIYDQSVGSQWRELLGVGKRPESGLKQTG